ncbi:MAG TPA: hypothetical protein VK014_02895 [Cyclobacteriaceae bacterium]|nr:hypothetical protein [Cyclobacteriaceae bacterium]
MQKNHFEKLLKGIWELEHGGPVIEIQGNSQMRFLGDGRSDFYLLEEEAGTLLLTIPSLIERSEVINISPTSLVVKERQSDATHQLRSFKRLELDI